MRHPSKAHQIPTRHPQDMSKVFSAYAPDTASTDNSTPQIPKDTLQTSVHYHHDTSETRWLSRPWTDRHVKVERHSSNWQKYSPERNNWASVSLRMTFTTVATSPGRQINLRILYRKLISDYRDFSTLTPVLSLQGRHDESPEGLSCGEPQHGRQRRGW